MCRSICLALVGCEIDYAVCHGTVSMFDKMHHHKISGSLKLTRLGIDCSYHFEKRQAFQQQCRRDACQISERLQTPISYNKTSCVILKWAQDSQFMSNPQANCVISGTCQHTRVTEHQCELGCVFDDMITALTHWHLMWCDFEDVYFKHVSSTDIFSIYHSL